MAISWHQAVLTDSMGMACCVLGYGCVLNAAATFSCLSISLIGLRSLNEEEKNCQLRLDKRRYFIFLELG